MPVEGKGRRFYRATGAAKGAEMLDRFIRHERLTWTAPR